MNINLHILLLMYKNEFISSSLIDLLLKNDILKNIIININFNTSDSLMFLKLIIINSKTMETYNKIWYKLDSLDLKTHFLIFIQNCSVCKQIPQRLHSCTSLYNEFIRYFNSLLSTSVTIKRIEFAWSVICEYSKLKYHSETEKVQFLGFEVLLIYNT